MTLSTQSLLTGMKEARRLSDELGLSIIEAIFKAIDDPRTRQKAERLLKYHSQSDIDLPLGRKRVFNRAISDLEAKEKSQQYKEADHEV